MARRSLTPPAVALWPLWGLVLLAGHGALFVLLHWRPGRTAILPYLVAPKLLMGLTMVVVAFALFDLMHSGWRRLFRGRLVFDGLVLLTSVLLSLFAYRAYPSSYDHHPAASCLVLPLDGDLAILHGGSTVDVNDHAGSPAERYAYDMAVVREGATYGGDGRANANHHAYGQTVVAPADGTVVAAVDGNPDHAPSGAAWWPLRRGHGNHVVLQIEHDQYLFLSHLQSGSIAVEVGETIRTGVPIGRVGNSGGSDVPHLHVHLQDTTAPVMAEGIPIELCGYDAVASGVSWDARRSFERGMPTGRARSQVIRRTPSGL